jgi:hypothetical protein
MTTSGDQPGGKGPELSVRTVQVPPPAAAAAGKAPAAAAAVPAPPPIPTGFPEPASPAEEGGAALSDTGALLFPQPMQPARPGHVNLAAVPPMGSLTVPPLEEGGDSVVIDVYGTEVDEETAERAYAAAQAAGLSLREL